MDLWWSWLWESEVDGTGPGSCLIVSFGITGFEASDSDNIFASWLKPRTLPRGVNGLFLGAFAKLASPCLSLRQSVRPSAWNNSTHTGSRFLEFYIWVFFENLSREMKFHSNLTRITGTLYEDLCTFVTVSRWIFLRMRSVSDKCCGENQKHTLYVQ